MKAAVHRRYGSPDVVTIGEMPKPVPSDDEVLIRVHAATVGVVDSLARRGTPAYARFHFGPRRSRFAVLGSDFAGQVEATGPAVTRFAAGDQVAELAESASLDPVVDARYRCSESPTRTGTSTRDTSEATSSSQ